MALCVKSEVKKHSGGMNVSKDFYGAIDKAIGEIMKKAIARAKGNGRKTLRPVDL